MGSRYGRRWSSLSFRDGQGKVRWRFSVFRLFAAISLAFNDRFFRFCRLLFPGCGNFRGLVRVVWCFLEFY